MLSAVRSARAPARETLFPDASKPEHLIDELISAVDFAMGIEAALRCPDLDGDYLKGVQEIARVHVEHLRTIGRMVEAVRS